MVYRVSVLAVAVIISSTKTSARIITYVLLCGYSPFRSDDVKELIRETTEAKIESGGKRGVSCVLVLGSLLDFFCLLKNSSHSPRSVALIRTYQQ